MSGTLFWRMMRSLKIFQVEFQFLISSRTLNESIRENIMIQILPLETKFPNNKICQQFDDFISSSLLEKVRNGSISVWGKEGKCKPLHLVMPLTTEPSKPRLCHDEHFLNLWMRTPKVSFDNVTDLPRYVDPGHCQPKLDDKSGYDHILLSESSREFFGLFWKG